MNAKDAWLATLGQLQIQLPRATYDTWLRGAELLAIEGNRFLVSLPSEYARDWLERYLLDSMTQALSTIYRRPCEIQFTVWRPDEVDDAPLFTPQRREHQGSPLHPQNTFDQYVVGESNRYAYLLAEAISEGEIGKYSPAFFVGDLGVGKTHLLHAITHRLLERNLNAIYVTAEEFTTQLISAIRGDNEKFRERFRNADAVLFDDLQFIEGKENTQGELVAIWDALQNRQRTLIFASDRLPKAMVRISGDLRSRLQAGAVAILDAPDSVLRRQILAAKAAVRRTHLPADVLDLLATNITTNIRDLVSAIEQITTYASLTSEAVTRELAHMALRALGLGTDAPTHGGAVTLERVLEVVTAYYRVSLDELSGRKRTKDIVQARQMAMYLAREYAEVALAQIGAVLGGRDHSTVAHGIGKIAELLDDPQIAAELNALCMALGIRQNRASTRTSQPLDLPLITRQ